MRVYVQSVSEVQLDAQAVEQVIEKYLDGIAENYFERKGKVFLSVEEGGHTSTFRDEEVKNPSKFLIAAIRFRLARREEKETQRKLEEKRRGHARLRKGAR